MGHVVKVAFYINASHEEVIYMALATFFDYDTGEITGTITLSCLVRSYFTMLRPSSSGSMMSNKIRSGVVSFSAS